MEELIKYQNKLTVMGLLMKDEEESICGIEESKKLQTYYVSLNVLETLKGIILENQKTSFIDYQMKQKILSYLDFFRDINTILKKEDKLDILHSINECISMCNSVNDKTDSQVFYTNQLYERTEGWMSIDRCYQYIQNSKSIETIQLSILQDPTFFRNFMFENPYVNYNLGNYNSEFAIWSINRFIYDIPQILENDNFLNNCQNLTKYMKKKIIKYYMKTRLEVASRIRKETNNLQKKLR